ncbi:MAG: alpha-2-macroglobulin family protein [Polaromonas sp.]
MLRNTAALLLAALALEAQALQILSLSPQGEISQVRQVVAKFDSAAVNFGDARAPAPLSLSCSNAQASRGSGRWLSDKEWVFDFASELPPGVRCTVTPILSFKSPSGARLTGTTSYTFNSGGPFVQRLRPGTYQAIDEEQYFILQLNGPATLQSLSEHVWCEADDLGERIPVRLIEGQEREALLKSQRLDKDAAKAPLSIATLACNRRLTPASQVQLVYGRGVSTPGGVANTVEKRYAFKVREPFSASFACERENAQSACLPIRPMRLDFNAPVTRRMAEAIRLTSGADTLKPVIDSGEGGGDAQDVVSRVSFKPPFAEMARFTLTLPKDFADASGRLLGNAGSFPMPVATGAMPPLAKFAAAPFGVVERLAEPGDVAVLPVTLRNIEAALQLRSLSPGQVSRLQPRSDAEIIAWFRKVQRYDASAIERRQAAIDVRQPLPKALDEPGKEYVQTRMLSLLAGQSGVTALELPRPAADPSATPGAPALRPFEVVGIPLAPGFHVVEIASPRLGASLLDAAYGPSRTMYVRTSALVTNLGVHFKLGRENAQAWVTTLDKGAPVAGATVRVSDCQGVERARAVTNAQGIANLKGLSSEPPRCSGGDDRSAWFVSARADSGGVEDLAFTWSDWHKGIEPWRFNVPTSQDTQPDTLAHTIFDRTLLRAGDTLGMKHLLRSQTGQGFGRVAAPPKTLLITHIGSGQQYRQPLAWRQTATGGQSAESRFTLPVAAPLGLYDVQLTSGGKDGDSDADSASPSLRSGQFRVEAFRLPVLQGQIAPVGDEALVNVSALPVSVQVGYVSGGAAVNLPVRVSALVRAKALHYGDHDDFSFAAPRSRRSDSGPDEGSGEEEASAAQDQRVIADKLPLLLDRNGSGKLTIQNVPPASQAQELLLEASYADPNGEVQTVRSLSTLWPASVVAGIKTEGWVSSGQKVRFQALALALDGKPAAGVALQVKALARITTTSRKRMVGGFYSYDNRTEIKDLGQLCSGKSDARGLLLCEAKLGEPGEVELVVTATDQAGRSAQAASSVYVTRQGELWFGGENHDRMDVLPEKKSYQPGETAVFQVRMPFRFATAWVAVEREGVMETQVIQLSGQDPTVRLQVKDGWGPNVYVSVLALRGRLREVPWYSFFTWGYKAPREWWTSFWYEGREYVAPTALVDLSKPAFRLGMAEIRVGSQAHQLGVSVKADKDSYPVRGQAQVKIAVKLPGGQPAAHAEVALAAVDEALLELMPNSSWKLLDAMLQRRAWGVETSTAQMEIIGRRHYGRKAVPAGGGGGRSSTRELLDTLLLWNPKVQLDAQGQATVTVPLNDALTSFRVVAVADASTGLFGTGQTTIRTAQDLQIISGLPPLVRQGDAFRAQLTLRNTTKKAMKVQVSPRAALPDSSAAPGRLQPASTPHNEVTGEGALQPQTIDIPAGEARDVSWDVTAPEPLAFSQPDAITWDIEAKDTLGGARDALKLRQRLVPAVPLSVQQATLAQIDGSLTQAVAPPADALAGRGGLRLSLQPTLAGGLDGVRDWFERYPYVCLEQQASKAIGLRDAQAWQALAARLPTYLDSDGLASYFPPQAGEAARGSDTLTAYLLAATHEASRINPAFTLPDEVRASMERGLIAFVEGRLERDFWSPRQDLDVRKLAALEALSRHGKAQGRMLGSLTVAPSQWPTSAVIDWLNILKRVPDAPQRQQRLLEASQILKSRLSWQGSKLVFSTEQGDAWWWLMVNGDVNTARLILAVMDDSAWQGDMARLANGLIARQQKGAWQTTTANLWGSLALETFSARFEAVPVDGVTRAVLSGTGTSSNARASASASAAASINWRAVERVKAGDAAGAPQQASAFGAPNAPGLLHNNSLLLPWLSATPPVRQTLTVTHQGSGKPWLTLQSLAAVPLKSPFSAGYQISKTITPIEQAVKGQYTRGDVLRVTLEVKASGDMRWVVISDPIPGGATILGTGLGRDSEIASRGEKKSGAAWPAFEERSLEAYRSYYEYLPRGTVKVDYSVRLNNVGDFALPPSRVEALYAPEMFGETPNARMKVEAAP